MCFFLHGVFKLHLSPPWLRNHLVVTVVTSLSLKGCLTISQHKCFTYINIKRGTKRKTYFSVFGGEKDDVEKRLFQKQHQSATPASVFLNLSMLLASSRLWNRTAPTFQKLLCAPSFLTDFNLNRTLNLSSCFSSLSPSSVLLPFHLYTNIQVFGLLHSNVMRFFSWHLYSELCKTKIK